MRRLHRAILAGSLLIIVLAGLAGTIAAAPVAARFASARRRLSRVLGPGAAAVGVSWLLLPFLFPPVAVPT